jgi:hypothetical protein
MFLQENKAFSLLHETIKFAAVAELADAQDLKGCPGEIIGDILVITLPTFIQRLPSTNATSN